MRDKITLSFCLEEPPQIGNIEAAYPGGYLDRHVGKVSFFLYGQNTVFTQAGASGFVKAPVRWNNLVCETYINPQLVRGIRPKKVWGLLPSGKKTIVELASGSKIEVHEPWHEVLPKMREARTFMAPLSYRGALTC